MKNYIRSYSLRALLIFSLCCSTPFLSALTPRPLTVIVHGTTGTVKAVKDIPVVYPLFTSVLRTPPGLKKSHELKWYDNFVQMAKLLSRADQKNFSFKDTYFFGWSGELSVDARREAAKDLYEDLTALKAEERYKNSPLTVITISHGGNVVLHLAEEVCKKESSELSIDQLILLCCPVQKTTESYVNSPIFKQVYNLFSPVDTVQIADSQQSMANFFSNPKAVMLGVAYGVSLISDFAERSRAKPVFSPTGRIFREYLEEELQSMGFASKRKFAQAPKIVQAEIAYRAGEHVGHIDFINPFFFADLPTLLELSKAGVSNVYTCAPGGRYCVRQIVEQAH